MKKKNTRDRIHDLVHTINLVKNCIKNNTANTAVEDLMNQEITFETKHNIQVQIKLYK